MGAQLELPCTRAPLPPGGGILVCVLVAGRRGRRRPRLRREQDRLVPGALNVAGPRVRCVGARYLAQRLVLVEATAARAAYWVASGVEELESLK